MPTLMLLRHAKSSRDDPELADRDRPLTGRGKRAARAIGRHLRDHGLAPDLCLVSPARRARDTWTLVAEEVGGRPRVVFDEALYHFGDGQPILDAVAREAGKARRVLVVAHNPTLEILAQELAGSGKGEARAQLAEKYPTGALAVLEFSDWASVTAGAGKLVAFVRPRDLVEG